jgi:flagellar hook-associated protein 2
MAGLSSTGIGSGLDVSGLVTQLVASAKTPLQNQIDSRRDQVSSELSGLSTLKSSLSSIQDALSALADGSAFTKFLATSSGTSFGASADASAQAGTYSIKVAQLATAAKASSAAFAGNTSFSGGAVTIGVGTKSMTIALGAGVNSLAQLAGAINRGGDNPGVSASVVHAADGDHLVLTSTQTGAANAFTVSASGDAAALTYDPAHAGSGMSTVTSAQDARLSVDGFEVTSASNAVQNVIQGVTINLDAISGDAPDALTVAPDTDSIKSAITQFVDAYNRFVGTSRQLTSYDAASKKAGALLGDPTMLAISSKLSRQLGTTVGADGDAIRSLGDLGIHFEVDGSLSVDADKLGSALTAHPDQVRGLFSAASGFGKTLTPMLNGYLQSGGILDGRTDSLNQNNDSLDDQQTALDTRMDALTAMYTQQFTKLDQLLTSLNSTSSFLTQQLAGASSSNSK